MQCAISCVLLLTVCGSWAIAAHQRRVILMVPKQVRRSPVAPWQGHHLRPSQFRKSHYAAEEDYPHLSNRPNNIIYGKPIHPNRNHLPHGGDDFDDDHDLVNNVFIPHGKGISHGLSYGRGYIPYDRLKGNTSPVNEDHSFSENHNYDESPEEESSFSPVDPSHVSLTTDHDTDSFYRDQSGAYQSQIRGTIDAHKNNLRSVGNHFGTKNSFDSTNSASIGEEKPILRIQTNPDNQSSDFSTSSHGSNTESTSPAPIFVPQPKIGGSIHGVVIRDSVSLDDYNRKVEEFTKSWPGVVNIPGIHGSNLAAQTIQQLPVSAFPGSSFPAASHWTSSVAQGRQGYAVKEELAEPQIDFRTMNFQNSQHHSFPVPGNANLPNIQTVYG